MTREEKTILYLDDESENLDGFKYIFRKEYNIYTAQNTLEAFNIIRNYTIKVVISDNKMPDMLGTEFFEVLSVSHPEIIRILVTAYADTEAAMLAINKGQVYRFISKPWDKNELQVTIENAFEAYNLRQQNQQLIENLSKKNFELEDLNFRLMIEVSERRKVEEELSIYKNHLEQLVVKRTKEIEKINIELRKYRDELEELVKERSAQLLESEQRLRTISDNLPGGAIFRGYTKPDNTDFLVYCSANITEITGISTEYLLTSIGHFFDKIHPDDVLSILAEREKGINEGKILDLEIRYYRTQEDLRWLHIRILYKKSNDPYIWWDGYVIDITDQKLAEQKAKEHEQIINQIHAGISAHTGEKLLETLSIKLSKTLHCHHVIIAQPIKNNFNKTLIFIENNKIKPNIQYEYKNTPCEEVLRKKTVTISSGLQKKYPHLKANHFNNADGYVGIPLINSNNECIGLIAAVYKNKIEDIQLVKQLLEIFSMRISAELERIKYEEAIQLYSDVAINMQIALNVFQLTEPNDPESLTLIKANPAAAQIINADVNQIIGKKIFEVYPHLRGYGIENTLAEVIRKEFAYSNEEFQFFTHDGSVIFFSYKAFPVPNKCVGILFEDITRKKLAEKTIRENEERYKTLFEKSPNGIHLISTSGVTAGKIISVNPAFSAMLGYNSNQLIGHSLEDFMDEFDENDLKKFLERLMAGETITFETSLITKSQEKIPVEITQSILNLGNELYILGISRDITEIKNAQQQLHDNIQFLSTLLETIPLPVAYKDKNRKFLGCNSEFESFIGLNRNKIIGKTAYDIFPHDFAQRYDNADLQAAQLGGIQKYEDQIVFKNKNASDIIITKAIFTNIHNQLSGFIETIFDITERKNFEIRLLDTIITTEEKERERFAGNLHDEVGPLLSSLKMYISLLADNDDRKKKDYILHQVQQLIKEAIQTVREISNDLSPHILNNYGFIAAINSYITLKSDFIDINFTHNLQNRRFSPNLEIIVYRITKELINNTLKHANAKHIIITIEEKEDKLYYTYKDDGKGFEFNEKLDVKSGSIGLLNIVSRIKTIQGKYNIKSAVKKGFQFDLIIPLTA